MSRCNGVRWGNNNNGFMYDSSSKYDNRGNRYDYHNHYHDSVYREVDRYFTEFCSDYSEGDSEYDSDCTDYYYDDFNEYMETGSSVQHDGNQRRGWQTYGLSNYKVVNNYKKKNKNKTKNKACKKGGAKGVNGDGATGGGGKAVVQPKASVKSKAVAQPKAAVKTKAVAQPKAAAQPKAVAKTKTAAKTKAVATTKATKASAVQKALSEALAKSIEPTNKGYKMLQRMGYEAGSGLGKSGKGIVEPLPLKLKSDRRGLGGVVENVAIKAKSAKKVEKIFVKQKIVEAVKIKEKPSPIQKKATVKEIPLSTSKSYEEMLKPNAAELSNASETKKRTHSPIRAPTPSPPPPPVKSLRSKAEKRLNEQLGTAKQRPAKCASPPTTPTQKSPPMSHSKPKLKRPKFSARDPATPHQLSLIAQHFCDDIELLRLRMDAEASLHVASENDLVVAKILMNNAPDDLIAAHTFEFIRTEIVGWIGKYQYQDFDTPIFHSMSNNGSHITIVCENTYAFVCLERCVAEISKMRTLAAITIIRLPPVSQLLYSFGAVYTGIIRDPQLFLAQVRAHVRGVQLKADRWIVVAHEVCPQQRVTEFLFLLDEPSALALTYHHNSRLFICMQQVVFTKRGVLPRHVAAV